MKRLSYVGQPTAVPPQLARSAQHFDQEGAGHATVDAVTVLQSGGKTQESGITVKTFAK
jgi:hypothetical protein